MPQASRSTVGTTAWTCPKGVRWVQAHAVGSGGAGGQRSSVNNSGAAGGRGGSYARKNRMRVTPGSSYNMVVGAVGTDGASPVNGVASTFVGDASDTLSAPGGTSCAANSQTPPDLSGTPQADVSFDGGAGGSGASASGGGGGGAGHAFNGGDASGSTAGTGTNPGGDGAAGRSTTGVGADATGIGGGGAGGRRGTSGTQAGGAGGPGLVIVRWIPPATHMLLGVGT